MTRMLFKGIQKRGIRFMEVLICLEFDVRVFKKSMLRMEF